MNLVDTRDVAEVAARLLYTASEPGLQRPYHLTGDRAWTMTEIAGLFADLWVPKTCATWADASSGRRRLGPVSGTWLAGPGLAGRAMIFGLWA